MVEHLRPQVAQEGLAHLEMTQDLGPLDDPGEQRHRHERRHHEVEGVAVVLGDALVDADVDEVGAGQAW